MSFVVVVGFGLTGRAVASYLRRTDRAVVVFDDHFGPQLEEAGRAEGVEVEATPTSEAELAARLSEAEMVVPSPGVAVTHPVLGAAARLGIPVVSEIELASVAAAEAGGPRLIAITGTNGKTTVTTMVEAILRAAGMRAKAAGNIGLPLIEAVEPPGTIDVVVAEVSSFQLQFTERFHPEVSCWLNLAEDHLDWHGSAEHYAAAKARIWANQGSGDVAVYNNDDSAVRRWAEQIPQGTRRITCSTGPTGDFALDGDQLTAPGGRAFMAVGELPRALPHDVANSIAAAAVATAAGASLDACRSGLMATGLLPHRVSFVAQARGVSWYDDSKATTPASVLAAVSGFSSVVLIAGGRNKGLDLTSLAAAVPPVRAVVAIGEAAPEVESAMAGVVPVTTAASMDEAVEQAARMARAGDSVLLSPGCASFDWYPSYSARGDHFASSVKSHLEKGGASC